ncbi:hypothetical protein [Sphingomonas sp. HDW15A]|nr:hypothetical protein [Sphingomonas sp. HDW15A]
MRATSLVVKLTVYYLIILGGMYVLLSAYPDLRHYLPVGAPKI